MRAREFVIEQADYVHPSIFLAVKRARETGGKVVRSAGGYFKVVPQDAPGEEYEIDPHPYIKPSGDKVPPAVIWFAKVVGHNPVVIK